jgi:3-hydroxyacyl-[acyl-carrier-protein] dehydratase
MNKLPLEIEDIKKLIPQRFPFLMIDRVLEASPEKVVAIKNVSASEHFFVGHFPDQKVMPGALMIEAMAQAALILYRRKFNDNKLLFLASVKAWFFEPIFPGDQLRIEVTPIKVLSNKSLIKTIAFVGDKKVVEAELAVASQDAKTHEEKGR